MRFARTIAYCLIFCAILPRAAAQQNHIYTFQKDDSVARAHYYAQALQSKNNLIESLGKENKKDYKEIYESRFEAVAELLKSSTTVTEPAAHAYLQSLLKAITDANPELKQLDIRMVFTRDSWPNAYSMGEGTIAVNAGLFVYFENEGQLVFTLCHELAHLYLDHGNKEIRKNVEWFNSDEFKKQAKQLSKQEYGVGHKIDELIKKMTFTSRRHSRDAEAEADKQALRFMSRTAYDCNQAITCLRILDKIDDTSFYKKIDPETVFAFNDYPFRKKWIEKESSIFASMSADDSPLTKAEKDSLKTHPDCLKRIALLQDSAQSIKPGKAFLTDEKEFNNLKKEFIAEMAEQQYRNGNLGYHLYLCLQLMQNPEYETYAAYAVVRCLNKIYTYQKTHQVGTVVGKESRTYPADYNLVLRMLDRIHLDEIANLSYYFAKKYNDRLSAYPEFAAEMRAAEKNKKEN